MTKVLDINEKLADKKRAAQLSAMQNFLDKLESDMDLNPRKYIDRAYAEIDRLLSLLDEIKIILRRARWPAVLTKEGSVYTNFQPEEMRWKAALNEIEELLGGK